MTVFKSKNNALQKEEALQEKETSQVDTSAVWNKIAKDYDKEISWDELVMGIGIMRRFLIGQAKVREKRIEQKTKADDECRAMY